MANAGGKGLGGHCIGDADKKISSFCGGFFDGDVEVVQPLALIWVEGEAVDSVNYSRIANAVGGESAEDAGFGGVGVDDVGFYLHKVFFDLEIAYGVVKGADCANHFGDDDYIIFLIFCLLEQFALGADGWACDEDDIVASVSEELAGN